MSVTVQILVQIENSAAGQNDGVTIACARHAVRGDEMVRISPVNGDAMRDPISVDYALVENGGIDRLL